MTLRRTSRLSGPPAFMRSPRPLNGGVSLINGHATSYNFAGDLARPWCFTYGPRRYCWVGALYHVFCPRFNNRLFVQSDYSPSTENPTQLGHRLARKRNTYCPASVYNCFCERRGHGGSDATLGLVCHDHVLLCCIPSCSSVVRKSGVRRRSSTTTESGCNLMTLVNLAWGGLGFRLLRVNCLARKSRNGSLTSETTGSDI